MEKVAIDQWRIHGGGDGGDPPRPILQLFFLLVLQHLLLIRDSIYQQKLLELLKPAILQKQAIIAGNWRPYRPIRRFQPDRSINYRCLHVIVVAGGQITLQFLLISVQLM